MRSLSEPLESSDDLTSRDNASAELASALLIPAGVVGALIVDSRDWRDSLSMLSASQNQIEDLSELSALRHFTHIYLANNLVRDMKPIVDNRNSLPTTLFVIDSLTENCVNLTVESTTTGHVILLQSDGTNVEVKDQLVCDP